MANPSTFIVIESMNSVDMKSYSTIQPTELSLSTKYGAGWVLFRGTTTTTTMASSRSPATTGIATQIYRCRISLSM